MRQQQLVRLPLMKTDAAAFPAFVPEAVFHACPFRKTAAM
jgi:hypothetical protein